MPSFFRKLFDIRQGELGRVFAMSAYLLLVLFAYYILKPVSRALFLASFEIDKVPYLYILIAVVGGYFATLYSKIAVQASLRKAVNWSTGISIISLVLFWWILRLKLDWTLYLFNIWSSLFGVITVAQGWLVAANVFDAREAKRLYGLVGLGAVLGGWTGSAFTAVMVQHIAPENLVLVCAVLMAAAYGAFRMAIAQKGVNLSSARADTGEQQQFTVRGMINDLMRTRHLQVIIGIVVITFIVDVMVEYQLSAVAKQIYGDDAKALARFNAGYFFWQNLATFTLQLFLTGLMIRWFGVGGTLQVMPMLIGVASLGAYFLEGLYAVAAVRVVEATSRYSFNRAGMELLYLPLPAELRNRTKAFVDIAVDRFGRGIGGITLVGLTMAGLAGPKHLPIIVIIFVVIWIALARLGHREYLRTIRGRLERRRLDLTDVRVTVSDPATIRMLEEVAQGDNQNQADYALSMLAESPGYSMKPLLVSLVSKTSAHVRIRIFSLAEKLTEPVLLDEALSSIRRANTEPDIEDARAGARYAVIVSPAKKELAQSLLDHPSPPVVEGVIEGLGTQSDLSADLIPIEWLESAAADTDPERRRLAAYAIAIRGDQGTELLRHLLEDTDRRVVEAACASAGRLKNRMYLTSLIARLADSRFRGAVISALAQYGSRIAGTLGDALQDEATPVVIRRQIPRVLRLIPDQRSVDILLQSIGERDLSVRYSVIRGLNKLRETAPSLDFGETFVTQQILSEARTYCSLSISLLPLEEGKEPRPIVSLLRRSLEERMSQTIERLFRLLGLRYPLADMHAAYLSVSRRNTDDATAAIDFLETVLDKPLRRVIVPILEPGNVADRAKELFGLEIRTAEQALRELIRGGDPWLVSCAIAAAAEVRATALQPDIRTAAGSGGRDVHQVAQSAITALA